MINGSIKMIQRKLTQLGLVIILLLVAAYASGATVDPVLRSLQAQKQSGFHFPYEQIIAVSDLDSKDGPTIAVILNLDHGLPDLAAIGGLVIGSVSGDIATARLPLSSLNMLAQRQDIRHIQAARMQYPAMDMAVPAAGVNLVWNGSPAYTGDGVLVGIIDSGIDWTHDDFKNTNGSTRIKAIYDLFATGTPPPGFSGGAEYTESQINAGNITEKDFSGHGTHVSGIATGNGNSSSGLYRGIAFESDIIFAKPFDDTVGGFPEDKTIDAINYITQKAQALGQPIAINMSLGGHFGPHDGTTAQEQLVNNLSGPGVAFCIAAGNEGEDFLHHSASAAGGTLPFAIVEYTENPGAENDFAVISVWVDGSSSPSITISSGEFSFGPVLSGTQDAVSTNGGLITVDNATGGLDPNNGDKLILISWDDSAGSAPASGLWDVTVNGGSGTAHAWKVNSTMVTGFPDSDQSYCVGMPGTAEEAVTVAAFKTRNDWPSIVGTVGFPAGSSWGDAAVGAKAPFSSLGPTRDGRQKPDVSAPGMAIVSCYSQDSNPPEPNEALVAGGKYFATQGTSMASPLTCGVVALMFEKDPNLTAAQIRSILRETAATDGFTGGTWNNRFGMGKLDALAALAAVSGGSASPGGDLNNDGNTTVLDVISLVNYILNPGMYPLSAEARVQADVYPSPAGDGVINISDLIRIVAFILGNDDPGKFQASMTDVLLAVSDPYFEEGTWWISVDLQGNAMAAGQLALNLPSATWLPEQMLVDQGDDVHAVASAASSQLRVLVYDLDNALPSDGVTLRIPFTSGNAHPDRPQLAGVLVANAAGDAMEVVEQAAVEFQPSLNIAPNPVRDGTTVSFRTAVNEPYTLSVFDLRGRRVRTLQQGTGLSLSRSISWDGRDGFGRKLPTGIYLVRLNSPRQSVCRKIVLDH